METIQSEPSQEVHLELNKFAKSIFEGNDEYDLLKNPNKEKHFEPIPNNFYGFCVVMPEFEFPETIDIEHEDVTNQKLI